MRLLPTGPNHFCGRAAGQQFESQRWRYRRGHVRQYLSVRYLSTHPGCDQVGGADLLTFPPCEYNMGIERPLNIGVYRRTFLKTGAAAGGGLFLGFSLSEAFAQSAEGDGRGVFTPNAFIRIDRDSRVTLIMPQVEMGQGTCTSMSMLIAEELEVNPNQVDLQAAPPDDQLYGNPMIG